MAGSHLKRKASIDASQADGSEKVVKETEVSIPGRASRDTPAAALKRKPSEMIEEELHNHRHKVKCGGWFTRSQRAKVNSYATNANSVS